MDEFPAIKTSLGRMAKRISKEDMVKLIGAAMRKGIVHANLIQEMEQFKLEALVDRFLGDKGIL